MKTIIILLAIVLSSFQEGKLFATTLHVGVGHTYSTPTLAAAAAQPGDTILLHQGTYQGAFFISSLIGTSTSWIVVKGVSKDSVILKAGSEGFHFSHIAYVRIQDLTFTEQTGNGMNIDDNGNWQTPSKHVVVSNCDFIYMGAQGNNDFLKLSGLDSFEITNCKFHKGATGGSGIDMVGCHYGRLQQCTFDSMGSNAIQMKGGTQFIQIENNSFKNAGLRALNLGGSTGLAFFRPQDAKFEAADLQVYGNLFIGSEAPIAYVGSERVDVANNTMYLPGKWVIRILQETVDTARFVPCRNNLFRNNIVYFFNAVTTHVNIGPNTSPATFVFSHNLWYNSSNPSNSTPVLPTTEISPINGQDPLFTASLDFSLKSNSPAIGNGIPITTLKKDMRGIYFKNPPSRGAYEYNSGQAIIGAPSSNDPFVIYPNPSSGVFHIRSENSGLVKVFNLVGEEVFQKQIIPDDSIYLPVKGMYFMHFNFQGREFMRKIIVN